MEPSSESEEIYGYFVEMDIEGRSAPSPEIACVKSGCLLVSS
jgi:hypothetical protein